MPADETQSEKDLDDDQISKDIDGFMKKRVSIKAALLIITALYLIMLFAVGNVMWQQGMADACNKTDMKLVSYNGTIQCMSQARIDLIRQFENGLIPNLRK